ncbi:hypothetical protein Q8A67_014298 [Cirrhinus molitorella]|uniref:Uncharacterized protein n=1 Tax=Cirrhinus molitorella TaxID=172907 RepID=A0AA88PK13_9TELE|nr:hypothetical protein Q8A67_014298 [Cirrhinus molitorella]
MFLSIQRRFQLSFVSPNITDDSRFRLSVSWVVGVTRARASRLDSRVNAQFQPEPAHEAPADHCYENTEFLKIASALKHNTGHVHKLLEEPPNRGLEIGKGPQQEIQSMEHIWKFPLHSCS